MAKSKKFSLLGRGALLEHPEIEIALINATESPIERPKKNQRQRYSGKKKRHTFKTQLIVNAKTHEIICTAHAMGSMHDFNLYEQSVGEKILDCIEIDGDSGYQGILRFHKNSVTPKKKPKGVVLSFFG